MKSSFRSESQSKMFSGRRDVCSVCVRRGHVEKHRMKRERCPLKAGRGLGWRIPTASEHLSQSARPSSPGKQVRAARARKWGGEPPWEPRGVRCFLVTRTRKISCLSTSHVHVASLARTQGLRLDGSRLRRGPRGVGSRWRVSCDVMSVTLLTSAQASRGAPSGGPRSGCLWGRGPSWGLERDSVLF